MIASGRLPLEIVVAVARNRAIGSRGALPWKIPGDLARFKAVTMGKPMVMGRLTYQAIGTALPGRDSIVVSRRHRMDLPSNAFHALNLDEALALAEQRARVLQAPSIALIGGATLFDAMITRADRLLMTIIDLMPEADTFFPALDPWLWREVRREKPTRRQEDEAEYVFVDFERTIS